jgi:hypothetical protein
VDGIGRELERELKRLGPPGAATAIARAWPPAVGEAIAQNSWPARVGRDGTLHVATSSSAWAFELTQLEATIAARLREALGDDAPTRLRFAPGPMPEPGHTEVERPGPEPARPGPAELGEASAIAAGISDDELRGLVARAAAASLARGRSGRRL